MKRRRSSGVLLHPTSFPGRLGIGDLGAEAYRFVDWLVAARQSLWQVLPRLFCPRIPPGPQLKYAIDFKVPPTIKESQVLMRLSDTAE